MGVMGRMCSRVQPCTRLPVAIESLDLDPMREVAQPDYGCVLEPYFMIIYILVDKH